MNNIIILLSSSTSAARLKSKLFAAGYDASIIGTPTVLSVGGCNYSVKTDANALPRAEEILTTLGIRTRGIYLDTGSGSPERYRRLSPEVLQ